MKNITKFNSDGQIRCPNTHSLAAAEKDSSPDEPSDLVSGSQEDSFSMFRDAGSCEILTCSSFSSMLVIELEYLSVNNVVFFFDISSALSSKTSLTANSPSSSFVSDIERQVL